MVAAEQFVLLNQGNMRRNAVVANNRYAVPRCNRMDIVENKKIHSDVTYAVEYLAR